VDSASQEIGANAQVFFHGLLLNGGVESVADHPF
jgi:hypothetical protein